MKLYVFSCLGLRFGLSLESCFLVYSLLFEGNFWWLQVFFFIEYFLFLGVRNRVWQFILVSLLSKWCLMKVLLLFFWVEMKKLMEGALGLVFFFWLVKVILSSIVFVVWFLRQFMLICWFWCISLGQMVVMGSLIFFFVWWVFLMLVFRNFKSRIVKVVSVKFMILVVVIRIFCLLGLGMSGQQAGLVIVQLDFILMFCCLSLVSFRL